MPTAKAAYVLNGFRALTAEEKTWLVGEINKDLHDLRKGLVKEAHQHPIVNFGPLPGGCPCCGV